MWDNATTMMVVEGIFVKQQYNMIMAVTTLQSVFTTDRKSVV